MPLKAIVRAGVAKDERKALEDRRTADAIVMWLCRKKGSRFL